MKLDAQGVPVEAAKLNPQVVNLGGGRRAALQLDALGRYVSHQPHHGGAGGLAALQAAGEASTAADGPAALQLDAQGDGQAEDLGGGAEDLGGPAGGQVEASTARPAARSMEEATAQAAQERPAALDLIPAALPELAPAPAAGGFQAGN